MVDFPNNPATLRDMVPRDASDRILGGEAALKTLAEVGGFVPLANRKHGLLKLASFHVFNALTLGFVGQVGALCANSQAMGSQKWYAASLKDFGQTYLNATVGRHREDVAAPADGRFSDNTFRGEKLLRKMTKAWSEGLGAVTGILIHPLTAHAYNTHRARLESAFAANFEKLLKRPPSMEVAKGMTIDRLVAISRSGNEASLAQAREEYKQILTNRPAGSGDHGLTVTEIMNGSDNLKTRFAHNLASDYCLENLMFRNWADGVIQGVAQQTRLPADPETLKIDTADYRLNKFDLALGHSTLIKVGSDYEVNLDFRNRDAWKTLDDKHLASFRTSWNKLVDDRKSLKRGLAGLTPGTSDHVATLDKIRDIEAKMNQMRDETLPSDLSKAFGQVLAASYRKIHHLMSDHATRLGNELAPPTTPERHDLREKVHPDVASKMKAALDGQYRHADYSDEFRGRVEAHLNAFAKENAEKMAAKENAQEPGAKVEAEKAGTAVFAGMAGDIGRSTYVFNDRTISSPRSGVDMNTQVTQFSVDAANADIPPEHLKKMSLVMHQGMFAVHQLETMHDPAKAPLPLNFGDVLEDDHRSDGTSGTTFRIQATKRPGVYDFVATTQKPMNNIQDFSDLKSGMKLQRTDEMQSYYVLQLAGMIDCNAPNGRVTLSQGQAGYLALPHVD